MQTAPFENFETVLAAVPDWCFHLFHMYGVTIGISEIVLMEMLSRAGTCSSILLLCMLKHRSHTVARQSLCSIRQVWLFECQLFFFLLPWLCYWHVCLPMLLVAQSKSRAGTLIITKLHHHQVARQVVMYSFTSKMPSVKSAFLNSAEHGLAKKSMTSHCITTRWVFYTAGYTLLKIDQWR